VRRGCTAATSRPGRRAIVVPLAEFGGMRSAAPLAHTCKVSGTVCVSEGAQMEAFSRSLPVMTGNPSEGMRRLLGTLAGTVPPGRPALAADHTAAQAACRSRLVRRDGRMDPGGAGRVRRRRTRKECAAVLRSRLSPRRAFWSAERSRRPAPEAPTCGPQAITTCACASCPAPRHGRGRRVRGHAALLEAGRPAIRPALRAGFYPLRPYLDAGIPAAGRTPARSADRPSS
jgi:hypothetical protein